MGALSSSVRALLERDGRERSIGPFVLVEQLGRGGFAPVWLAKETYGATVLRTAAVKLFALETRGIVEEARALCRVEHPNVVRFYALPIDEAGGVMGLAMEHVAGTPLDQRLAHGRPTLDETLAVGAAVASALSAVHRAGLVHRDVKPANIIDAAGVYKLIDFGIAAADALPEPEPRPAGDTPAAGPDETVRACVASGTVGYIDPACVARGETPAPCSDLYALGATLFELVTGAVPAAAEGGVLRPEVLDGSVAPPPLCAVAPEVPSELGRVVDALLRVDRAGRPTSAEAVAVSLERLRGELRGRSARALPPEEVGPFRGLGRFEEGDREVYFGRASETAASLEMLRTRGLVALVGASGTGKSSLARAGVLPAVKGGALAGHPRRWEAAIASPGGDPRSAIGVALEPFVPAAATLSPEAVIAALVQRSQAQAAGTILLVDQLEELSNVAEGEGRAWAVALLSRLAAEALPGVRVLVTVRRDLLDPLLSGELGRALSRGIVLIEPISDRTWADVLRQALDAYGYAFEDAALEEALVGELAGTATAMPLVQFALTELWTKRDTATKRITRRGLEAIGGIAGALERHAEATLAALSASDPHGEASARSLLLALTTPQGTRVTRSPGELRDVLGPAGDRAVESLERARLIVMKEEGITLAHEALLTQWGRLRAWVGEARGDRLLAEELERDAAAWRADPDVAPPWARRRLAHAEDLEARAAFLLSATAVAFVRAGRKAERRVRVLVGGAALAALLAAGAGGLAYVRATRAYVRAVQEQESKTEKALQEEQRSRRNAQEAREVAEDRTREVEQAQARITELLRKLDDSPTKVEVVAQQAKILQGRAPTPMPEATSTSSPVPSTAALSSAPPGTATPQVRVKTSWE